MILIIICFQVIIILNSYIGNNSYYVNFDKFVGIFIFLAVDSKIGISNESNYFDKVIAFLQRFVQAKGFKNLVHMTGSTM
jgi:hypothetical protein